MDRLELAQWFIATFGAPLLGELGASIDHIEPHVKDGDEDTNLRTICARCNPRKGTLSEKEFLRELKPWRVMGRHGEPKDWGGMSAGFGSLARKGGASPRPNERQWLEALTPYPTVPQPSTTDGTSLGSMSS